MLKRKDRILISALALLVEQGVAGLTTKQLAAHQSITEPALYRQFKDKQAIIDEIIRLFGRYDEQIHNTIRQMGLVDQEALYFYVRRYCELLENNKPLTTVMFSMDLFFYDDHNRDYMKTLLLERLAFLTELIETSEKLMNKIEVEPKEMASLIQGIIISKAYEWRMVDDERSLSEAILRQLSLYLPVD